MIYYPEMDEKPATRMFKTFHVHGNTYGVEWAPEANEQALEVMKKLRIKTKGLQFLRKGIELNEYAKSDKWTCIVTGAAHSKLLKSDICAHQMLLD